MRMSLAPPELAEYLRRQLNTFFPDSHDVSSAALTEHLDEIIQKVEHCFSHVRNKYFTDGVTTLFNHLHADHYSMFLAFAARTLYKQGADLNVCSKIVQLNKCLHGIDLYYEIDLPDIFLLVHPLGSVLGRAAYGNYLIVYQRCSVGSNHDVFPVLGEYVTLRPGATVLGNCRVGNNCTIAAGSLLLDQSLDDNTVYIGKPRDHFVRHVEHVPAIWGRPVEEPAGPSLDEAHRDNAEDV